MIKFSPPNAPYEEEYWEALIVGGENGGKAAPQLPSEIVWRALGVDAPEPTESRDCSWQAAKCTMLDERWLDLPVTGYNRGGLLVDWNGRQGFVPASHLADFPAYSDEHEREEEMSRRVGQTLRLKIIEVDPDRSRLVLSECATRSDEEYRQQLLNELTPGEIREGVITNLCSFGAFVDLGGIEGLVHISEISWGRVDHPSDQLTPGEKVQVYVLNVDHERGRVGLSIKRAQSDPWETLHERYQAGQIIKALITNVVDFGAFAQVEEGVEGLIHISELTTRNCPHPSAVVEEGQTVYVRILNLDCERRRLGLSLRQTEVPD